MFRDLQFLTMYKDSLKKIYINIFAILQFYSYRFSS